MNANDNNQSIQDGTQSSSSISMMVLSLVKRYRSKAHLGYLNGQRPQYLQCEKQLGAHCAELFEEDLVEGDFKGALKGHLDRCPRGRVIAVLGLAGALGATVFGAGEGCGSCTACSCSRGPC